MHTHECRITDKERNQLDLEELGPSALIEQAKEAFKAQKEKAKAYVTAGIVNMCIRICILSDLIFQQICRSVTHVCVCVHVCVCALPTTDGTMVGGNVPKVQGDIFTFMGKLLKHESKRASKHTHTQHTHKRTCIVALHCRIRLVLILPSFFSPSPPLSLPHTHTHTHTHTHIHTHAHTRTYTHTHAHTHADAHTHAPYTHKITHNHTLAQATA